MHLAPLDWFIIFGYLGLALGVGVFFSRRAGRSIDDYFVAGRSLPWWIGGLTMVASAFAIDTPLGITGMVASEGIQGVWYAWSFVLGGAGTLGAFIFASLLRRSEVITTAELVELRYSGRSAAMLRLFKGVYFGVLLNAVTLGAIIKAVWTVTDVVLGWNPHLTLGVILVVTLGYTALSGMWGIAATDFLQFFLGLAGLIVLLTYALNDVGGIGSLVEGFRERYGDAEAERRLRFVPRPGDPFFDIFLVFVVMKWWGNPPSAIHQRIVSSKDEKHASLATLTFAIMQFAVNYWPMILIAMVSLVSFPELATGDAERGYPMLIVSLIPTGLLGLLLASMMAAFMSTVDTHINYGASYMVNDIYRRFLKPDASDKHYVKASRASTVLMLLIAVAVAYRLESVSQAWYYLATMTAGYGFLIVIRWFWWRINAWSEIAALLASGVVSTLVAPRFARDMGYGHLIEPLGFATRFLIVVVVCTLAWVITTYLTKPCDEAHLVRFCRKVKPFPSFWGPIYRRHPDLDWNPHGRRCLVQWIVGSASIYGICFGIGHAIFGRLALGLGLLTTAALALIVLLWTWTPADGVATTASASASSDRAV
ncbi:MAG: sodium:solute symporter family protein [Acidobacteriota bacterium]